MGTLVVPLALAAVLVLAVGAGTVIYMSLIRKRGRVDDAWSQIEVLCERRYELVPELIDRVKAYASHERNAFGELIRARTAAQSASGIVHRATAESLFTTAVRGVFAVAEPYPQLQAHRQYAELQGELADAENRIAYSRQHYNEAVDSYNGAVHTFPTSIVAGIFGFEPREFFTAREAASGPARVKF